MVWIGRVPAGAVPGSSLRMLRVGNRVTLVMLRMNTCALFVLVVALAARMLGRGLVGGWGGRMRRG